MLSFMISGGMIFFTVGIYMIHQNKKTRRNLRKIKKAKEYGLYEPVHIHPHVDSVK